MEDVNTWDLRLIYLVSKYIYKFMILRKIYFFGNSMNLYDDFKNFSFYQSTAKQIYCFSIYFFCFYLFDRTVSIQIICEYFNQFNQVFQISHIKRYTWPIKTPKLRRNIQFLFSFDCHKPKYRNGNINL